MVSRKKKSQNNKSKTSKRRNVQKNEQKSDKKFVWTIGIVIAGLVLMLLWDIYDLVYEIWHWRDLVEALKAAEPLDFFIAGLVLVALWLINQLIDSK